MRIATHIKLFLTFIILLIAANAYIGTQQINRISDNLRVVVNENFELVKQINLILQFYGEKAVIMERAIRISEELNYQNVPGARRSYLINHSQLLDKGFTKLNAQIVEAITHVNTILTQQINVSDSSRIREYRILADALVNVTKAYDHYHNLAGRILSSIANQDYILNLEDTDTLENAERGLNVSLKDLHGKIEALSHQAISNAEEDREVAINTFRISLIVSFVLSLALALFIMSRISRPLWELSWAARKIGEGQFDVKLKAERNDEVADVGKAFNIMTDQLAETNAKLKTQSQMLQENLSITEEQKRDLEKVNQELDRFVYTVTHDIGAPLMGIAWYGNYLKKNIYSNADEKAKDAIDGIVNSAARLNTLVNDLLALTRLSRIKNPYETVSIHEIVKSVLDRVEFQIKQSKTKVKVADDLPTIICDRVKIGEVFYNLINNGIKFSQKSNEPTLTIAYKNIDNMHEFSVADNGIGIDQKYHGDIFGIFRRLHTYSEYEGSGAGLTIVKTIINDHGGNIWVDSREGEGAKFVFTIPDNLKTIE